MWEFRNRNVFGATAFSTYGGFWIGLGIFVVLARRLEDLRRLRSAGTNLTNALAWFLFAFAIFNTYMLLWSTRVNTAVFLVFLTLEITEILLVIGFFNIAHGGTRRGWLHAGGWAGIVTAGVAWYTSAAGVVNGMSGRCCRSARRLGPPARIGRDRLADAQTSGGVEAVATEASQHAIETMFLEERTYPPPEDFAAQANAQADIYDVPFEDFWEREGRERVTWFEPFSELYEWEPPYAKWYLGGKLNVCFNCVDRHVEAGAGEKVAFHWEGEPEGRDARRSRTRTSRRTSSASRTRSRSSA